MRGPGLKARLYIYSAQLAGLAAWAAAFRDREFGNPIQFLVYIVFSSASSTLKVRLPGITGTLSVNYVFILLSAIELDVLQTLAVAAAGTLTQTLVGSKAWPKPIQISFNLAITFACAWATHRVYHAAALRAIDDSVSVMLLWASCTYFLFNTASVAGVIAVTEGRSVVHVWKENFFWTGPQYLFGGALAGLLHTLNRSFGWQYSVLVLPALYLLYRSYHLYLSRLSAEKEHVAEVAELHLRTIEALALAIEAKDETTHAHLRRVQIYAVEMGKELGLDEVQIQALAAAALLHDIGKLAVPEYILSKPGRLTAEEFEKIKIHPIVGAEVLERVKFPYPVAPVVRAHHEKWDGSGYPFGLKGACIPLGARILTVVDVLDALASDRQYRRALPLDEAVKKVVELSGKDFDPRVTALLERRYRAYEKIVSEARTNEVAFVQRFVAGGAPATGFEAAAVKPDGADAGPPVNFIALIAAARQEFHMLHEMTRDLGTSLRMEDTLSLLASRLKPMVPHHTLAIYVIRNGSLVPQYVSGDDAQLFSALEIPMGEGLAGWVAQNRKPILNGNPSVEPGYLKDPAKFSLLNSGVAVPLEAPIGLVGVMALYHRDKNAFSYDHLRILMAISAKAALTIANAMEYGYAKRTAAIDQLTGLANAHTLFVQLDALAQQCLHVASPMSVLVLDLDGFKQVNDLFGHLTGNKILESVAQVLRQVCRKTDCVARMGGDEFVLVLPGVGRPEAEVKAEVIRRHVSKVGCDLRGNGLLGVSIGISCLVVDGANAEELLAAADKRMYEEKQRHHASTASLLRLAKSTDPDKVTSIQ